MAQLAYATGLGEMWLGDCMDVMKGLDDGEVNLIVTSPPFALTREKEYGNVAEDEYVEWFVPFAREFKRIIAEDGSLVIDLGGAWMPGQPTKSIYQFKLLVKLVDELGFFLAQDCYWFNRAKLPGPAQWVTVNRTRLKDAVNTVWWLSKTPQPKASNLEVLRPYSAAMKRMIRKKKYNAGGRPSQHHISKTWAEDRGGAIAPNVIEVDELPEVDGLPITSLAEPDNLLDYANTTAVEPYHKFCKFNGLQRHPARFPPKVVEHFIKMCTEEGEDLVVDPFGGSNVTGQVAEDLKRRWVSVELEHAYIQGSLGRFSEDALVPYEGIARGLIWP